MSWRRVTSQNDVMTSNNVSMAKTTMTYTREVRQRWGVFILLKSYMYEETPVNEVLYFFCSNSVVAWRAWTPGSLLFWTTVKMSRRPSRTSRWRMRLDITWDHRSVVLTSNFYQPRSRGDYTFGSVRPSVDALTGPKTFMITSPRSLLFRQVGYLVDHPFNFAMCDVHTVYTMWLASLWADSQLSQGPNCCESIHQLLQKSMILP